MLREIFPVLEAAICCFYIYLFFLVFFVCFVVSSRGLFSSCFFLRTLATNCLVSAGGGGGGGGRGGLGWVCLAGIL